MGGHLISLLRLRYNVNNTYFSANRMPRPLKFDAKSARGGKAKGYAGADAKLEM